MTEKLYDISGKIKEFEATVVSCSKRNNEYLTELDRTAFFPESGGQCGDTGDISGRRVLDTQYDESRIIHITDGPFSEGEKVMCKLDWEPRFRRMQNHTGEHIVSALMHKKFGFTNVGFHLGKDEMTFDFDGVISREQMNEVEYEANIVAASNFSVRAYYPDGDTLKHLEFRSKGELSGAVRIVEIEGVDMCACCAPHVENTGEVGIIKILGFVRYKGGIRVRMQCGLDALDDYRGRIAREEETSNLLCVPQEESSTGVKTLLELLSGQKKTITELKKSLVDKYAESISATDRNICVFIDNFDASDLRELGNLCAEKCRLFAACCGNDENGYLFVCASRLVPLRDLARVISQKANGKCGGSDLMLTGRLNSDRQTIKRIFEEELL